MCHQGDLRPNRRSGRLGAGRWLPLAVALLLPAAGAAQLGPRPFAAFPTQAEDDGRFLGFGCRGIGTFEQDVAIGLSAPADDATFVLNLFDGDTGGKDGGGSPHWDEGDRQLLYRLYADPLRNGSTDPANLVGAWTGNEANPLSGPGWTASAATMPDNDWWAVTVTNPPAAKAPSGNYFYNLLIAVDGPCGADEVLESDVKVATSSPVKFRVPRFGLVAALRQIASDGPILYPGEFPPPGFDFLHAPTTYDGTFETFVDLPGDETDIKLYDGDFDFGNGELVGIPSETPLLPCADTDDPDTPDDYAGFPFDPGVARPEGAAGCGLPAEDSAFDLFRRGEPGDPGRVGCVRYELVDPDGKVYRNDDPSGSYEWEQFRIATPLATDPGNADVLAGTDTLPGGIWKLRIFGLDLSNLNFWAAPACSTYGTGGEAEPACPTESVFLVDGAVLRAPVEGARPDLLMTGIPGVDLEIFRDGGLAPIATVRTGDGSDPNWAACLAHNPGRDVAGVYCFGLDTPGVYTVKVAAANYLPGGPLAGLAPANGVEELTDVIRDDNVLLSALVYRQRSRAGRN